MKVKVKYGVWGNYKGYEGSTQVFISSCRFNAIDWLVERLAKGDCELSPKSDITAADIEQHVADLKA